MPGVQFAEPHYLWLLALPAGALPFLVGRMIGWRRDTRVLRRRRLVPVRERFAFLGPWPFWLCLLLALTSTIVALARPQGREAELRTAGVDLIVLQDGSASMHVRDVGVTRWQRSMRFLRTMAESLDWVDDRMALALFARIAAPQVRLTRDPTTFFFFLDHLGRESPFPLRDDATWDTNIELGIHWGVRLLDRDEQLNGVSDNAKAFVLVSDGQAWSGEVQRGLALARSRNLPMYVVGVGTETGGFIPDPPPDPYDPPPATPSGPIRSVLDRSALQTMAVEGRGAYFELGRTDDARTAGAIVDAVRRRAGSRGLQSSIEELYWKCLIVAAAFLCMGVCFVHDRADALLQAIGATAALTAASILIH